MKSTSEPRVLLRRLHQLMAGQGTAQVRLDKVVKLIAQNMIAEVCSIYLARAGDLLELFATEGLREEAVHKTRLHFAEGLVGLVAERGLPLNLSEAPKHPKFAYRPETGEDIYHSFMGVPILRGGRVLGVLVVQNVAPRRYGEEEVEVMQTTAMVLAEMVASGELVDPNELAEDVSKAGQSIVLDGMSLAHGVGIGAVVFHEIAVKIDKLVSENVADERVRLQDAIAELRFQLEQMSNDPELSFSREYREVLETYRMFAYDRGWHNKMGEAIETGLTAEGAVDRVQQENRARLMKSHDPYLRERGQDFENLATRLIRILQGDMENRHHELIEDSIIFGRTIGPAELLDYDRSRVKGIVLEDGSPTSHLTIVARALEIPLIGRAAGALMHVNEGDKVVIDTESAHIFVRPSEDILETYASNVAARVELAAEYAAESQLPVVTKDGHKIGLMMNAGLLVDLPNLDRTGADGIGLYRTEFQFMVSSALPRVSEQVKVYNTVLDAAGDREVIFRTLDVGGDKQVGFLPREEEENPAMGWRAIRIALDRPALLRYQIRALLIAACDRNLSVMFPMIAEIAELRAVKAIFKKETDRAKAIGRGMPKSIKLGCMLEVPSLAWQLDLLMQEVDFVSIGTNDLMQFFFACDRGNPRLSDRYDLLSPAVLSFLKSVIDAGEAAGVPVTLCGEMGAKPLEAMALVGLGLKRLSVSSASIGSVRRAIRSVDLSKLRPFLEENLDTPKHSLRDSLVYFARDHGVML